MDAKRGSIRIRAKTPRTIAIMACLGMALGIGACGDDGSSGTPATPALLGVLDGGCAEIPPSTPGGFRLLPHAEIGVRVAAAWPSADLVVKAKGVALEKVGPSDTARQNALDAAGAGYWVPRDINPNPTPPAWTVGVKLPASVRADSMVPLELVSRTPGGDSSQPLTVDVVQDMHADAPAFNRVQLDWRDRGDELGYLLQRSVNGGPYTNLVSLGRDASSYTDTQVRGNRRYSYRLTAQACGPVDPATGAGAGVSLSKVDVTTPKETGVDEITFFRSTDPADDQFVYTNPLLIFMPEDAIVTSVTNISEDENGNGVRLELVRHTDANGVTRSLPAATCPNAPLAPGDSTTQFDGQTVQGNWRARAVCISAALLNDPPARIALRISWTQ
jgi:hypothetical protein